MTFIAIIFSVPLTQRTVLNTDLGADSCGLHITERGTIKPEERNYITGIWLWRKILNIFINILYPGFVYIKEVSVKLVNKIYIQYIYI